MLQHSHINSSMFQNYTVDLLAAYPLTTKVPSLHAPIIQEHAAFTWKKLAIKGKPSPASLNTRQMHTQQELDNLEMTSGYSPMRYFYQFCSKGVAPYNCATNSAVQNLSAAIERAIFITLFPNIQ